MKLFLKKTILIILTPLLPITLIELYISYNHDYIFKEINLQSNYSNDFRKHNWIQSLKSDSVNLLSGSSTVLYGLSCEKLNSLSTDNSVYANIAGNARGPIQTYFILKSLKLNSVRRIYFGLDPWVYTKKYYKHRNSMLYLDFNIFESLRYMKEHDESILIKRYKAICKFIFKKNKTPDDTILTIPIPKDFGSKTLNRKPKNFNSFDNTFQLQSYGWSKLQFIYLKKIEDLCKENNIDFLIFIPPKRSDFSKYYLVNYKKELNDYKKLLIETRIESPIFCSFNIMNFEGDFELFSDPTHLNEKGQYKFSEVFHKLTQKELKKDSISFTWF